LAKVRLNIEVSPELADILDSVAKAEHATRSEIVRRAISVLKACKEQREMGRPHLGFVKDPRRLDAEILGIFNSALPASVAPLPAPVAPLAPLDAVSPPELRAPATMSKSGPVSMEAVLSRWTPHTISP
jgi:hypothetical protein